MVKGCRFADIVIEDSPLIISPEFLDKFGINCVVHGDDSTQSDFFAEPVKRGIMHYLPYTPGISTTDIIKRILARADDF